MTASKSDTSIKTTSIVTFKSLPKRRCLTGASFWAALPSRHQGKSWRTARAEQWLTHSKGKGYPYKDWH
jgi:hypothetical protein